MWKLFSKGMGHKHPGESFEDFPAWMLWCCIRVREQPLQFTLGFFFSAGCALFFFLVSSMFICCLYMFYPGWKTYSVIGSEFYRKNISES